MPIISVQQGGLIYEIFRIYGDGIEGRRRATIALRNILKFYYGETRQFNFYGTAVDSNGYITKTLPNTYNNLISSGGTPATAMAQIESSGLVNISFVTPENPRYEYPWYYEYRIRPYSTIDRFLYNPKGIQNFKYLGCKLSGTGVNIDSTETVDGGPVVKVTVVNQNQIVFSNNNVLTARSNTSGLPVRQLTTFRTNSSQGDVITNIPSTE